MPSDTETTGTAVGIGYSEVDANNLLAKFEAGKVIFAADINTLLVGYADFQTHTHTVVDTQVKDTFGNTEGDQSKSTDRITGDPNGTNILPANPTAGTSITAAKHNEIRNALNSLRGHTHTWNDTTS